MRHAWVVSAEQTPAEQACETLRRVSNELFSAFRDDGLSESKPYRDNPTPGSARLPSCLWRQCLLARQTAGFYEQPILSLPKRRPLTSSNPNPFWEAAIKQPTFGTWLWDALHRQATWSSRRTKVSSSVERVTCRH